MNLSITVNLTNGSPAFVLADLDLALDISNLRILPLNEKLKNSHLISDLIKSYNTDCFKLLSDPQLTIAIYFYLKGIIPSKDIIKKWLRDSHCKSEIAHEIAGVIFEAVIDHYDDPEYDAKVNILLKEVIGEDNLPSIHFENLNNHADINVILNELQKGYPISWLFDNYLTPQTDFAKIDLSNLREGLFQMEDHSNLIIGLASNCLSMIELLSAYNPNYLDKLCKTIPIGLRDFYSVGSCLIAFPEIMNKIFPDGFSDIDIYGMDHNGLLRKYSKSQAKSFNHANIKGAGSNIENNYLPLYLKLTK